jgi:hypothetical protein
LTTYTHHPELQVITALSLISTLYKLLAHAKSIFYCLRFETPSTRRARTPYLDPPGTGWSSFIRGTGFPFRRLLRPTVEVIRTRLHTGGCQSYFTTGGLPRLLLVWSGYIALPARTSIENTVSNIVFDSCASVAPEMYLSSRYHATDNAVVSQ